MSDDTYLSISIDDLLPKPGDSDSAGVVFPAEVVHKLHEDLKKLYPGGVIKIPDPGYETVELRVAIRHEDGRFVVKIPQMNLEIPIEEIRDEAEALEHAKKTVQEMADRAMGALYIDTPAHLDEDWGNTSTMTIKVRRDTVHRVSTSEVD